MTAYYIGLALNTASLLAIGGLGSLFAINNGDFNLAGEGQVYLGGFLTAIFLASVPNLPFPIAIILVLLLVFLCGALIQTITTLLKWRKSPVLLTSFLLSAAIIPIIDWLVSGPFQAGDSLLATSYIPQNFRLTRLLPPSTLNTTIVFSLIFCVAAWAFLSFTRKGNSFTVAGISNNFASYSGINTKITDLISLAFSGGFLALSGAFAILGTYYTCHQGFYGGFGWNALTVALLSRKNPLALIPSSLFVGALVTFTNQYSLMHSIGFDFTGIVEAVILFLIVLILSRGSYLSAKIRCIFKGGKK